MAKFGQISGKWLIVLILIAIFLLAAGTFIAYHFYTEKLRQEQLHRDGVRSAYEEKLSVADAMAADFQSRQPPANKNHTEEYQAWVDGYGQRLDGFASAINESRMAGTDYQQAFGKDSEDYTWVTENNTRLNASLSGVTAEFGRYQADYQAVAAAKEQARQAFNASYDSALAAYATANASLFAEDYSASYPGLKAYLTACALNLTRYKACIGNATADGVAYQEYLPDDSAEYESIMARTTTLKRGADTLDKRNASLQSKIPRLNLTIGNKDTDYSAELGWYNYYTFRVTNTDYPAPVWNVTAHFTSFDRQTGQVRDRNDVPVTILTQSSRFHGACLRIDRGHNYDITWTLSYDY